MKLRMILACIGLIPALSSFANSPTNHVFAVGEQGRAYPVATIQDGQFVGLRLSIEAPPGTGTDFVNSNLVHQAQPLYLYRAGRLLQNSSINELHFETEAGCSSGDYVEFKAKDARATLVTTSPLVTPQDEHSSLPDKGERRESLRLAAEFFQSKHVPAAIGKKLLAGMKIKAIRVRDGEPKLLTFTSKVETQDRVYVLFALAERTSTKPYGINYVDFYADESESAAPGESEYVDHLDLDGDGVAEIVFSYSGYEWWGYKVFKKLAGKWQIVHQQAVGGC